MIKAIKDIYSKITRNDETKNRDLIIKHSIELLNKADYSIRTIKNLPTLGEAIRESKAIVAYNDRLNALKPFLLNLDNPRLKHHYIAMFENFDNDKKDLLRLTFINKRYDLHYILSDGLNVPPEQQTIHLSNRLNDFEFKLLFNQVNDHHPNLATELLLTCSSYDRFSFLVDKGADIYTNNYAVLKRLAERHNIRLIKYLFINQKMHLNTSMINWLQENKHIEILALYHTQ